MTFRLSLKILAGFSHQMGTMLGAGLPIRRALAILQRGARFSERMIYIRLLQEIERGGTISDAVRKEGRAFPVLFHRMVKVGETVGGLEKVFNRLGDYFDFVRSMWSRLLIGLLWPLIEYWAMILVLALVAYIRGMLANDPNAGVNGLRVLLLGLGIFCAPIALYFIGSRMLGGLRIVHQILLGLPVIGKIMRTIAIARFSWSMELMTQAGVRIFDAIIWSLQATTNGAFEARGPAIVARLREGTPLSEALERSGLFPYDYIEMINVAQESGSMPNIFGRLAKIYFDKMDTALKVLTRVVAVVVWMIVAAVIIYHIFYFYGMVGRAVQDVLGDAT